MLAKFTFASDKVVNKVQAKFTTEDRCTTHYMFQHAMKHLCGIPNISLLEHKSARLIKTNEVPTISKKLVTNYLCCLSNISLPEQKSLRFIGTHSATIISYNLEPDNL